MTRKHLKLVTQLSSHADLSDPCGSFRLMPGRVPQLVARQAQEPDVPGSIPGPATYFRFFLLLIQVGELSVTGKSICT